MKASKLKKIIILITLILAVAVGGSFFYLKQNSYTASTAALTANKQSVKEQHYDLFKGSKDNDTAIIFYPGALVEKESYSIWASELSQKGYDVYIMDLPLNLAVLAPNVAEQVIDSTGNKKIILAGHSLGGVMASRFAAQHPAEVKGMIFLASYPDEKGALKKVNIPALSITATNDKVINEKNYEESKKYLPENSTYAVIKGGNHSGFGSYGLQKKDLKPTISNELQQEEISTTIDEWLKALK